jgi:hypothetical protein
MPEKTHTEEVRQAATFWFVMGICACFFAEQAECIAPNDEECIDYAMTIVYPVLVLAPVDPPVEEWED